MSARWRVAVLPLIAVILVSGVLAVQLAYGGGTYVPLQPANPCADRHVSSQSTGIEGLTERIVLMGLDNAACSLGVSREALTLDLAQPETVTDAEIDALRSGMVSAVHELNDDGSLPPVSQLVDEAIDASDLSDFVKVLIRAIPDSVIDAALKTDDVLTHVIDNLDLRTLLTSLDDQDNLDEQLQSAVTHAVLQSLVDRVRGLL